MEKIILKFNNCDVDLSDYINNHPGGYDIIKNLNGKESQQIFDDVGHSKKAIKLLNDIKKNKSIENIDKNISSLQTSNNNIYLLKIKLLFTHEDYYLIHKIFGIPTLFIYLYMMYSIFIYQSFVTINSILYYVFPFITALLSLQFNVSNERFIDNRQMMTKEQRAHTINFTMRSLSLSLLYLINPVVNFYIRLMFMLLWHGLADIITYYYNNNIDGTIRGTIKHLKKSNEFNEYILQLATRFPSIGQYVGIMMSFGYLNNTVEISYLPIIPVQLSALLATLVRKGLISCKMQAILYGLSLFPVFYISLFDDIYKYHFLLASLCSHLRFEFNINKYFVISLLGYLCSLPINAFIFEHLNMFIIIDAIVHSIISLSTL